MKRFFLLLILVAIACSAFAQTKMFINKTSGTDSTPTVIASEEWRAIMDNDSTNQVLQTFEKYSDGSFTTNGTWNYVYQGSTVQFPFSDGTAIIVDTVFSFTAQGTATNPAAPSGHQSSAFTLNVTGIAHNGKSSGTYTISFSAVGWPAMLQGTFTATKISGSGITVSVKEVTNKIVPEAFMLFQNYPNPFNPSTTISFALPSRSFVSLKIFDLLGREVATIVTEEMSAGSYSKQWNATNVSSGIYYYRLQAGTYIETKKLVLLK